MVVNKKFLRDFDFSLLIDVLLICTIGIVAIASATRAFNGGSSRNFTMQIAWTVVGLVLLIVTASIDYSIYKGYSKVIYFANVAMLALVIVVGTATNGSKSWFGIGPFGVQPSEFMKVSLIILIARKIEDFQDDINNIKNIGIILAYTALPLGLIMLQPDLGTAMVIVFIVVGMLFMAGLNLKIFFWGIAASIVAALAVWFSPVPILKEYQRYRILTFINPEIDPLGNGYHITQSKIAIGSGQLFGMGFGKGLQNEGRFLPESHTDFIFAVLAEEFGFVGAGILILLYAFLMYRCVKIAKIAKDKFGSMVVMGVMSMFLFQMFQNVGMTIGIMPITGITLPFVSYGGSSMLTSMISIGLILNIGMRKHKINF